MKILRAVLSGALVWVMVFALFTILSFIPVIKDSLIQQNMIVFMAMFPFAIMGAAFYYKKGDKSINGLAVGGIMVMVSLLLDAIITVPYVIIPKGGTYSSFFMDPMLGIISIEFIAVVFFYWKTKVEIVTTKEN